MKRGVYLLIIGLVFVSGLVWLSAEQAQAVGTISSAYLNLAFGGGRLTVHINVSPQRWNELWVEVSSEDLSTDFELRTPNWRIAGIRSGELGRRFLGLQRQQPTSGRETVLIDGPSGRGRLGRLAVLKDGARLVLDTNQPTFLRVEVPPPGGGLLSFITPQAVR